MKLIKFDQLKIDLGNISNTTIKKPKIQETSTLKLSGCIFENIFNKIVLKRWKKK